MQYILLSQADGPYFHGQKLGYFSNLRLDGEIDKIVAHCSYQVINERNGSLPIAISSDSHLNEGEFLRDIQIYSDFSD